MGMWSHPQFEKGSSAKIVVIGAGVAGLTTALQLLRKGHEVTIVSEFTPGDLSIGYTSPWAGANWLTFYDGGKLADYDAVSYPILRELARSSPEAGIRLINQRSHVLKRDLPKLEGAMSAICQRNPWFKNTVDSFEIIEDRSRIVHDDVAYLVEFASVCIHAGVYLNWLMSQCLSLGATVDKRRVNHIKDANLLHSSGSRPDVIVNCSGLFARFLGGVEDKKMYPIRGQVVLVRNSLPFMASFSSTPEKENEDEALYIMTRFDGTSIIGGCFQPNNWSSEPDPSLTHRILSRALDRFPELTKDGPLDIVRGCVGHRPGREGGPRVELEKIPGVGFVVHNYGAAGAGYQSSYGMADEAVSYVERALTRPNL
nr:D-amino acid oxidase [synthetic construct]